MRRQSRSKHSCMQDLELMRELWQTLEPQSLQACLGDPKFIGAERASEKQLNWL